jgi:hypothetical protein
MLKTHFMTKKNQIIELLLEIMNFNSIEEVKSNSNAMQPIFKKLNAALNIIKTLNSMTSEFVG